MRHTGKDFWLAALRADGAAFLAAIEAGVQSPVPSCPGWTIGDLARHLGAVYRRIRVRAGSTTALQPWGPLELPPDAPAGDAVVPWFAAELAQLDAFLDALDPDAPAWNWAPQRKTAAFWHRRLAHETAVHRWDAQIAVGRPEPLEAKLAADTVAEVLDTLLPAGRFATPPTREGLVRLVASDLGHGWWVRLRGRGVALLDTATLLADETHHAQAVATGSASDLALALWGRVPFDAIRTTGEVELLTGLRVG